MTIQDEIIFSLEEKIKRIVHVAEKLQADNERLRCRVDELSEKLHVKDREKEILEADFQNLKLTKSLVSSPEDVKNVKLQVNRMVREIDRCIALLNK